MTAAVYLGIGSNVDAPRHVEIALQRMDEAFHNLTLSPIYRSRAVGFEGDDFINLVARIETDLEPLELRDWLRRLEDEFGRRRDVPKYSDRVLDIDILLFDERILDEKNLQIPRPEIFRFAHVLRPLAELAPSLVCPGDGRTLKQVHADANLDESGLIELDRSFRPL